VNFILRTKTSNSSQKVLISCAVAGPWKDSDLIYQADASETDEPQFVFGHLHIHTLPKLNSLFHQRTSL
jgi:hypothetical protein